MRLIIAVACLLFTAVSSATDATSSEPTAAGPSDSAWAAAAAALERGPRAVKLRDQATLNLPEGYGFVPREPAAELMTQMGNTIDDRFVGLVLPLSPDQWFVAIEYEPSGYIEDSDARDWDADAMLEQLKEGTEAANAHRTEMGIPAIEVTRWIEPPNYDATTHELIWSAESRLKDASDDDPGVNYNTYVLGREGFVSLNLVTSAATVDADKPAAKALLMGTHFNDGKRYEDFDSSTDSVAAFGLAALVGGVAAKKLGLLAVAGAFFAKFAKLIAIGVAGAGAAIGKLWKRDKRPA